MKLKSESIRAVSSAALESPSSGRRELALPARWVAPQGEDVDDPRLGEAIEDRRQPLARLADAAQVGHGLDPVLALDPGRDLDRAVTGGPAGPVGDRDVVRLEWLQRRDRVEQGVDALRGLRREELEREHRASRGEQLVDSHGRGDGRAPRAAAVPQLASRVATASSGAIPKRTSSPSQTRTAVRSGSRKAIASPDPRARRSVSASLGGRAVPGRDRAAEQVRLRSLQQRDAQRPLGAVGPQLDLAAGPGRDQAAGIGQRGGRLTARRGEQPLQLGGAELALGAQLPGRVRTTGVAGLGGGPVAVAGGKEDLVGRRGRVGVEAVHRSPASLQPARADDLHPAEVGKEKRALEVVGEAVEPAL